VALSRVDRRQAEVPLGLPAGAEKAALVEAMFDRIAPRYDLMNRLMTLGLDRRWRRLAVRLARVGPDDTVVDVGCGSGDMCELAAGRGARVIGVDFAAGMLAAARRRVRAAGFLRADLGALPLATASATVVTCSFVLRNLVSIPAVLGELARILAPGGRLVLLEVDEPRSPLLRLGHALYFRRLVPLLGALLSDRAAYAYLPRSTAYLPPEAGLLDCLAAAGLQRPRKVTLAAGAAQLILAER
jgi:demethylmenaquinone methyltransferase/2-methoxy-6-polyprenyl-1,4-benzoquinol methylase